jgi:hypothetical protein
VSRAPPISSAVALLLLPVSSCGRPSEPCREPLDAYCVACPTFDEVLGEEMAGTSAGWDDVHVVAYRCGEHHLVRDRTTSWYMGQTEYYASSSGELLGVDAWSDVLRRCDGNETIATLYGDVPDCEPTCLLFEHCPYGEPCEPSTLDPCER